MKVPIHDADCYTEIRKVKDKGYMELIWNCIDECPIGGENASV